MSKMKQLKTLFQYCGIITALTSTVYILRALIIISIFGSITIIEPRLPILYAEIIIYFIATIGLCYYLIDRYKNTKVVQQP